MEQCEIDPKVQFSSILSPIFVIRGANWSSEKCKGGVLMCQGQIGEIPYLYPGKLGLFLILGSSQKFHVPM